MNHHTDLSEWAFDNLHKLGITGSWVQVLQIIVNVIILAVICWGIGFVVRLLLRSVVRFIFRSTKTPIDDIFFEKKVFRPLVHLFPCLFLFYGIPLFFRTPHHLINRLLVIYILGIFLVILKRALLAVSAWASRTERYKDKPIKSYSQAVLLIAYIFVAIVIISLIIGKSPLTVITAMGAATVVLLLVFRGTIMGLVASIQISVFDMVRVGDWIAVNKFGCDGNIVEINLMTIKVQNWDKTITNLPTESLITDGFKNYRGMEDMGIRQIAQEIFIDIDSIRELQSNEIEQLRAIDRIKPFFPTIDNRFSEGVTRTVTNIELFRKYMVAYVSANPNIFEYVVARVKQSGSNGVPVQLYTFSKFTTFMEHEGVQSLILEHLYTVLPDFGLKAFQSPSGRDLEKIKPTVS